MNVMSALELSIWAKVARRRRRWSKSSDGIVVVHLKLCSGVDVESGRVGYPNFAIAELGRAVQ